MATQLTDLVTTGQLAMTYYGTITTDTTTASTAVDCQLIDGPIHAVVVVGNYGDSSTTAVVSFTESDTSAGSYTAISGADTLSLSASATANDNSAHFIKADKRSKRYVKMSVLTAGGGTPSVPLAMAIFGRKKISGEGSGNLLT